MSWMIAAGYVCPLGQVVQFESRTSRFPSSPSLPPQPDWQGRGECDTMRWVHYIFWYHVMSTTHQDEEMNQVERRTKPPISKIMRSSIMIGTLSISFISQPQPIPCLTKRSDVLLSLSDRSIEHVMMVITGTFDVVDIRRVVFEFIWFRYDNTSGFYYFRHRISEYKGTYKQ